MLAADLVGQMIGDRELKEMSRDSFVSEDWPRVFDRRADVEVSTLWVVRRDEVKAGRVAVVDPRRVHESAGARGFERLGQLPDLEPSHVTGDRDEMVGFEKIRDLGETDLIRFEKIRLVSGNASGERGIGRREARVLEPRFQGAISRQLDFAERRDFA